MTPIDGTSDEVKCEDLVKITVGDDPEKFFQVGSQLPQQEREELVKFLKRDIDVFTWNTYEAPGVDLDFICHHLNVNPLTTQTSSPSGSDETQTSWGYQGGLLSQMVGKHGSSQEKEWEVASVC